MAARFWTLSLVLLSVGSAHADDEDSSRVIPGHTVNRPVDGGIQLFAVGAAALAKLIPARGETLWANELLGLDLKIRDNFSPTASHLSDGLLALSVLAPAAYLTGTTIDDVDGDRLLLYTQTMAIDIALASLAKHLVQRPRPYLYSKDPAAIAYAKTHKGDNFASFYSGHSAISFGAAMAGAYLLGASEESTSARNVAFGVGFGVAAATASLRVRAGKHFISDVVIGSVVGIGVGYAVPALHATGTPYLPTASELGLASAGIVGGVLLGQLLPLGRRTETLDGPERSASWQLAPTPIAGGMGFGVVGSF